MKKYRKDANERLIDESWSPLESIETPDISTGGLYLKSGPDLAVSAIQHKHIDNDIGEIILDISTKGEITWNRYGEKIEIKDKELLGIALIDMLIVVTDSKYDYSLLDKKLYKKYQKFLASKKD